MSLEFVHEVKDKDIGTMLDENNLLDINLT